MFKKRLATARKEILVNMVKMVQQRQMKGAKGNWHEFLNFYDPKFGASLSDPKRRSADLLVSFLETFTEGEDVKFLKKVLQRQLNREDILQLNTNANLESSIQKLIRLTFEHPEYASSYSFPSYDKDWVVTRISKSKTKESNKMVAVDCEMVRCEDQTDAVVKVCVVDQNLGVKLDKVVNPGKPISDYRSKITGITAKDLEGVTCTLADVQKSMKKLLSDGTILIGHSLHCDLEALKLDHARVIDTSLIFKCTDGTYFKRPSLNHLCKVVLNREVREEGAEHNCLDDACAAMKVVLAKLKTGFDEVIFLDQKDKLFLHRIPVCVSEEELRKLFSADSAVVLKPKYKEKAKLYSAIAAFKDQHEALETFQSIEGEERKDSSGFRQKLISVQLKNASCAHIYVRKMVRDDRTALDSSSRKRRIQEVVEPSNEGSNGQDVCFDITVVSPFTRGGVHTFTPGVAVGAAITRKRNKYLDKRSSYGYGFNALAFSTLGELGDDTVDFLTRLKNYLASHNCNVKAGNFLFHRIGLVLQKGIGAQLVARLPTNFV